MINIFLPGEVEKKSATFPSLRSSSQASCVQRRLVMFTSSHSLSLHTHWFMGNEAGLQHWCRMLVQAETNCGSPGITDYVFGPAGLGSSPACPANRVNIIPLQVTSCSLHTLQSPIKSKGQSLLNWAHLSLLKLVAPSVLFITIKATLSFSETFKTLETALRISSPSSISNNNKDSNDNNPPRCCDEHLLCAHMVLGGLHTWFHNQTVRGAMIIPMFISEKM